MGKNENDGQARTPEAGQAETRYRVTINSDNRAGGDKDVALILNGRVIQIKRNVPVLLTREQLEILQNAEERAYKVSDGGQTRVVPGTKRFSYILHGEEQVPAGSLDTTPFDAADALGGVSWDGGDAAA